MMNALRLARVKAVVATLYVAAMLAFGFAHAPLPAPTPAQAALAWLAESFPDGAIVAFCGEKDEPADESRHALHRQDCAACQLASAQGLAPAPEGALLCPPRIVTRLTGDVESEPLGVRKAILPPSRGPPIT